MKATLAAVALVLLANNGCKRSGISTSPAQQVPLAEDAIGVTPFVPCEQERSLPPLHAAARSANLPELKRLISEGMQIDARSRCDQTPLIATFALAVSGPAKSLSPTKKEIADENARTERLNAARMETALWLLDHGADPNASDRNGNSVLHHAARFGSGGTALLQVLERLVSASVDVNGRNRLHSTPLMGTARFGRADVGRFLLAKGADPMIQNLKGQTALDIAREENHKAMIEVLEQSGR